MAFDRAARYCDERRQRADYERTPRRICTEFVHPPRTHAFRTERIGLEEYAHSPMFALTTASASGLISTANKVGCEYVAEFPLAPRLIANY